MKPRKLQCEVFWFLLSNSKHSGVPEDSKSPTLEVLGFTPTLGQSGVATLTFKEFHQAMKHPMTFNNVMKKTSQIMVPLDIEHQTNNLLQHSLGIIHAKNNMSIGLIQMFAQKFKVPYILVITYNNFKTLINATCKHYNYKDYFSNIPNNL